MIIGSSLRRMFQRSLRGSGAGPVVSTLLTDIAAYWKLDEGLGNCLDSVGTAELARSNAAIAAADGKINSCIQLVSASSQSLAVASQASFQLTGSRTWAGWVKFNTATGQPSIFSKETASLREINLGLNASNQFRLNLFDASNNAICAPAWTASTPTTGVWYFVLAYYNAATAKAGISVDGGAVVEVDVTGTPRTGTADMAFGRRNSSAYLNGYIDGWGVWTRVLTTLEIAELYAAGAGNTYPFNGSTQIFSALGYTVNGGALIDQAAATIASDAWANASDVNSSSNRQKSAATIDIAGHRYQAVAYWHDNKKLVLGKRTDAGSWTFYTYDGTGGRPDIELLTFDAHNSISIGIDSTGVIHFAYDMHGDALNYRKSDAAISAWTGGVTAELAMLGTNESQVSYPNFFRDTAENLYFMFRDGGAGDGAEYFYKYTPGGGTWAAAAGTGTAGVLITGRGSSPKESPYMFHQPQAVGTLGGGGYVHFMWCWRQDTADTSPDYNHDLCYVRWNGTNFYRVDGSAQTVPITPANCNIAVSVPLNNYLLNQCASAVDSYGKPHYAYIRDGSDPAYQQLYHGWVDQSNVGHEAQLTGTHIVYGVPSEDVLTRPEIVIDGSDKVYIVVKNKVFGVGLYLLSSADWVTWTQQRLFATDVGSYEPNHDPYIWRVDGDLAMMIFPWLGTGTGWNIYYLEWTPT